MGLLSTAFGASPVTLGNTRKGRREAELVKPSVTIITNDDLVFAQRAPTVAKCTKQTGVVHCIVADSLILVGRIGQIV